MKIARVFFDLAGEQRFFFDRPYDDNETMEYNCNKVITHLKDAAKEGVVLSVWLQVFVEEKDEHGNPKYNGIPAILNLARISFIIIRDAGLVEFEEVKK